MTNLELAFIKMQIPAKQRLAIYNKLVKFMKNGVSLPQSLDIMWRFASEDGKKKKKPAAVMLDHWRRKVRDGVKFGSAISGWVPEKDATVILSGEAAGNLIVSLENAIYIHNSGKKIKGAIVGGLAYPVLLIGVLIGFMYIVSSQVVPAFESVVPRDQWSGSGAGLAVMADFVNNYLMYGLGFVAVSVTAIIYSLPRWTGRARAIADGFAPYSLFRLSSGAGFLLSLSAMVKAGISVPQALKLMRRTANPWYKERINGALAYLGNGKNFGEALYLTGHNFPDKESVADLRAYASLDGFDETLQKLGSEWMEDSIDKINTQSAVMRNIAFILLGGVFMWIASGIFSLQQQIANGV